MIPFQLFSQQVFKKRGNLPNIYVKKIIDNNSLILYNPSNGASALSIIYRNKNYYLLLPKHSERQITFEDEITEKELKRSNVICHYDIRALNTDLESTKSDMDYEISNYKKNQREKAMFRIVVSSLSQYDNFIGRTATVIDKFATLNDFINGSNYEKLEIIGNETGLLPSQKDIWVEKSRNYGGKKYEDFRASITSLLFDLANYEVNYDGEVLIVNKYDKIMSMMIKVYNSYKDHKESLGSLYSISNKNIFAQIKNKRKQDKIFNSFYLGASYAYSNLGMISSNNYHKNLTASMFQADLSIPIFSHNIGKKPKGSFSIDGKLINGKINLKNIDHTEEDELSIFTDKSYFGGLSYMFMFDKGNRQALRFIIQPGLYYNFSTDIKTTNLKYIKSGEEVPENMFILKEKEKLMYSLVFRITSPYRSNISNPGLGFYLGVQYRKNHKIVKNPEYNLNTTVNGIKFSYPNNSLYFFGGLTISY